MKPFPPSGDNAFWRDPDLPGLEVRISRFKAITFPKHTHDSYNIGFVESGDSRVFLRGKHGAVDQSDVVFIHPGEVHACNPQGNTAWAYRMFSFSCDLVKTCMADIGLPDVSEPGFAVAACPDTLLRHHLAVLYNAMQSSGDILHKHSTLLAVISRLATTHAGCRPSTEHAGSSVLCRVRDILHDAPTTKLRLVDLAEAADAPELSRYALLRSFSRAFGLSPHAYQLQLRLHRAKLLLRQGVPIVQVALDTGFVDQSHFTTTFRATTGATPGQYQRGR
ncbi:AraC family transcriptional regulator [Desulfovibrio inopinatus]|uniref:AraC family transcriptional regulator n=1 Tax=Desulfovibrio inopinatus TaxID=102109 RepID=UPI00040D5135|nr:AraC family transcriptional regulator [Desulfovibrio inopinatus]